LHEAVVAASAEAGFYITTGKFSAASRDYAASAPIKLVDGEKLVASIKQSLGGAASSCVAASIHVATCTGWTAAIDGTPISAHQARNSSAVRA